MRKTLTQAIGLLTFVMGILVSLSMAQQTPKVGIVNSRDILEKSSEGKKIIARLQDADKQNQAAIAKLDADIQSLQTKLNTQRLTLTEEAVMQYTTDLDRKQTERKRKAEDAYASMQEMTNKQFKKLQDELIPIIIQLGKEKGLDIVFDLEKCGAIYFNPLIDLTPEVIKRYDASKAAGK
jgi:outer membrane protein